MTKLHELAELGQSIWLDYIRRSFTDSGDLQALINEGLRGVTSNPTIFDKAISGSSDYDSSFKDLVEQGKSVEEIFEALAIADIQQAANLFCPLYDKTNGRDGFVSLEVSPKLAYDTEGTQAEAKRLFKEVDRPNVMIKIPATPEGIPAIKSSIAAGLNINVTLIFSLDQYKEVVEAYISGLEVLAASDGDVSKAASVASFFVSRVDGAVDDALEEAGNNDLQGKIAIDNAKLAYAYFQETFDGQRWQKLADQGARVQRPLWASTSVKNPEYPDTLYVDNLIGPHTVNTVPSATLDALKDHATIARTVDTDLAGAKARVAKLAEVGVDLDQITQQLLEDGVDSFAESFESLLEGIAEKRDKLS